MTSHPKSDSPELGGDFPEVDLNLEGNLEDQILHVVIEALNGQGYPGLSAETLRKDPQHRAAAVDMLRDCRPMPVILSMISRIEQGEI